MSKSNGTFIFPLFALDRTNTGNIVPVEGANVTFWSIETGNFMNILLSSVLHDSMLHNHVWPNSLRSAAPDEAGDIFIRDLDTYIKMICLQLFAGQWSINGLPEYTISSSIFLHTLVFCQLLTE